MGSIFLNKIYESALMNIEEIRLYCLRKKAVTEEFPFDETTLVFKVMGKIFVCISLDNPNLISMKCQPEYALELREQHPEINEARYFNKKYWNQVSLNGNLTDDLIRSLIDHSYSEVVKKIPVRVKLEYENKLDNEKS